MSRSRLKNAGAITIFLAMLAVTSTADANMISWITPSGSTTSDGSVSAQADFTLSASTILLVLTNLQQNLTSDGQELSGLTFGVTGASGSGSLTTVNLGDISTIDTGTNDYTVGISDLLTRWEATESGTTIDLTTLTGGQPNRLIIGPDNMGGFDPNVGQYTNANPSVSNHNPNVLGTARFTITVPGVTSASQISSVSFEFGTQSTPETVGGQLVPEPSMLAGLLSAAVMGLAALWLRPRRRTWLARWNRSALPKSCTGTL